MAVELNRTSIFQGCSYEEKELGVVLGVGSCGVWGVKQLLLFVYATQQHTSE